MTVKQARIAFIDAQEALKVAKFETVRAEKRLELFKRKSASPALIRMVEEEVEKAFDAEDEARESRKQARIALDLAEGIRSIDAETNLNVGFEKLMARFDRFVAGL